MLLETPEVSLFDGRALADLVYSNAVWIGLGVESDRSALWVASCFYRLLSFPIPPLAAWDDGSVASWVAIS